MNTIILVRANNKAIRKQFSMLGDLKVHEFDVNGCLIDELLNVVFLVENKFELLFWLKIVDELF